MNRKIKLIIPLLFIAALVVIINSKRADSSAVVKESVLKESVVKESVEKSEQVALPKLLDLGSHSCVPCKMMMPILDTLTREYKGKLNVEFIDIHEKREAAENYAIRSIPTQIFYDKNGVEQFRHEGFWSREEILSKFEDLGIEL